MDKLKEKYQYKDIDNLIDKIIKIFTNIKDIYNKYEMDKHEEEISRAKSEEAKSQEAKSQEAKSQEAKTKNKSKK